MSLFLNIRKFVIFGVPAYQKSGVHVHAQFILMLNMFKLDHELLDLFIIFSYIISTKTKMLSLH